MAQDTVNCDLFRGQNGYMSFIVDPKLVILSCNEQLCYLISLPSESYPEKCCS